MTPPFRPGGAGRGRTATISKLLIDVRLLLCAGAVWAVALMHASAAPRAGGAARAPVANQLACRQRGRQQHQARAQYELLSGQPYGLTSDDVLYETQGRPKGQSREEFFSKGQPCLRAAALGKRYGWGSHHNAEGKVALYGVGTPEYEKFANDTSLKQLKAMRGGK